MQLPVKAHYAALAMIAMAMRQEDPQPVAIRTMADEYDIPLPFLTQILQQLKSAGLVTSTRGAAGGYRLQRSPEHIRLADIFAAVGLSSGNPSGILGNSAAHQVLQKTWSEIDRCVDDYLRHVQLSQLVEQTKPAVESMFYI